MRRDVEEIEDVLSQLVQKVCLYALQSGATRDIIDLYLALPSKRAALPSLNLLIHLTIQTIRTDFPDTPLENLAKKSLDFALLRTTLPTTVLKSHIYRLLGTPALASLAVSIARDWKEHINYDDEEEVGDPEQETTSDFLDRVERQYLTATEGVVWRFEDVLSEWMGIWPDGRQLWSNQIPRTRKMLPSLVVEEEDDEEEFAGSIVKRVIPRSGLVVETPVPKKDGGETSERKGILERLFKLSSIGQTEKKPRTERIKVKLTETEEGISFLQRMGLVRKAAAEEGDVGTLEEGEPVKDDAPSKKTRKRTSPRRLPSKGRKRRRFDHTSDEDSIDEEESDVENIVPTRQPRKGRKRRKSGTILLTQLVDTSDEEDPATSDVDELSISIKEPPRAALARLAVNRRVSSSMRVRESSPITPGDESDDELAM
jgi:hypothetical protein